MPLDTRTLLVVLTVTTAFLALAQLFYLKTRQTYPGFKSWTSGMALVAAGYLLMALRGLIPLWFSVLGGMAAILIGAAFICRGGRRFLGLPDPGRAVWLVPGLVVIVAAWFLWVRDDLAARAAILHLGITAMGLCIAWPFFRQAPGNTRLLYWTVAGLFAAVGLNNLTANLVMLLVEPGHALFTSHPVQFVSLLLTILFHVGWTLGFMMMNGLRLEEDLRQTTSSLTEVREEVNKLSTLLPICASCKRIHDDEGDWQQIEDYISSRSEVQFTHGICPDCLKKLYPEYATEVVAEVGAEAERRK